MKKTIDPFLDEFYSNLSETYIYGIPVDIYIRYLQPILPPGKCFDRSMYMFLATPESVLVRGDLKSLKLKYGDNSARHGWIEVGDYVYDSTSLLKYKKDVFYDIYQPSNVVMTSHDEFILKHSKYYYDTKKKLEDYLPGGYNRTDLYCIVLILEEIFNTTSDENLKKALENYFKLIEYNRETFKDEMEDLFQKKLKKRMIRMED